MANVLGITAFNSDAVLKEWWEWTLVAIIIASGAIGIIAFVWTSYSSIRKLLGVRLRSASSSCYCSLRIETVQS
jgi:hypothetical protein